MIFLLTAGSVFALPPGPLAQISSSHGGLSAAEFRRGIEGAETIEVSFKKTMKIKDSEKSFIEKGKIYYKKEPLLFRVELPGEVLQIDGKTRKRLVKKYNEIYIDAWAGGNPLFMYFDIPGGVYESGSLRHPPRRTCGGAPSACVVFSAMRDGDKIEAVYDRDKKMLKSLKVVNPVMETFTEIESWKTDGEIPSGVFAFSRGAKRIDMRK